MKAWKRNLLIAYVLCDVLMVVFFYMFMFGSHLGPFLKFLLFVLGLAVIAGIFVGIYLIIYAFAHEHATLHAGPGGIINIERSALESTARRALASVPGITVQHVRANVIERKGEPVIDITVTAIPFGDESLMTTAGHIQTAVKRSVEGFTDHEVRYVAVNFVEPRKRDEIKAAAAAVDKRVASGSPTPRYTPGSGAQTAGDVETAQQKVASAAAEAPAPKVSLWDRAKARVTGSIDAKDEDVVETDAVVETVEAPAEKPVEPDEPQASGEPADVSTPEPVATETVAEAVEVEEPASAEEPAAQAANADEQAHDEEAAAK